MPPQGITNQRIGNYLWVFGGGGGGGGGGIQQGARPAHARPTEWGSVCGGPGQRVEEQGTWASRTRKHSEAGCGRPEDGGVCTAKTVKRPPQQPAQPQYANYWAPLTRKRHILPHPTQPQHTHHRDPRTRKRHQQEHRPQRPPESSDPTQHAKGRTGDCPGPRKETTTRRNVTPGVRYCSHCQAPPPSSSSPFCLVLLLQRKTSDLLCFDAAPEDGRAAGTESPPPAPAADDLLSEWFGGEMEGNGPSEHRGQSVVRVGG